MKILINRKPVSGPWGGGNLFVSALVLQLEKLGHEVVFDFIDDIDVIFMQDPRYSDLGISINEIISYKASSPTTRLIHRVNECDARKNTSNMDNLLKACSYHNDITIFVSEWMKNYHLRQGWKCNDNHVIYNGVNHDHFSPLATEGKINNNKTNIITHHWSNNYLKGFDVYEWLDKFVKDNDEYTFTYIGRENGTFKNTTIIPPLSGQALGNELSKYDVYVSGSRFDPGPNHILESLACEIPTYVHVDGGGAVEFAGLDHMFQDVEGLLKILKLKNFKKNSFIPHSWETCIDSCIEKMLY